MELPSPPPLLCLSRSRAGQRGQNPQRIFRHRHGISPCGSQIQITPSGQSPFTGSVAQGKIKPEPLPLTFQDAIDLGLKNNLGVLLQSYNTIAARGQKWKELSALLPNLTRESAKTLCRKIWRLRAAISRISHNRRALRIPDARV